MPLLFRPFDKVETLNMFNLFMFRLFRLCQKDEISRKTRSTLLAFFGNKVECCFDKVERCFDIVAGVDGALNTFFG